MLDRTRKENEKLLSQVMKDIKENEVRFISLQFVDILGIVKSVTVPVTQLEDCVKNGKWFDGSSVEGFTRIAESDMFLLPDLSTYKIIPWEDKSGNYGARIICWVCMPDGEPFEGDPRYVLAKAMQEAEDLGYSFNTGPELEFFLFKKDDSGKLSPLPHDNGGYFDFSTDEASEVRKDMVVALEKMGIEVETSHHEVAAGQHEIDFKYDTALKTADNALTFKYTLKAIAQKHGLYATFMPKPIFGINGSGMHVHQSLFTKDGHNAFVDQSDKHGLSKLAKQFIAGQLHHARALSAIIAPTVNSYKRLVPGYEAPVYIGWGQVNRSALIRIPRISKGVITSTRIELRCPDPSCNPYLAFAAMLKAGLDGIKRELTPPEPAEENLYHLDTDQRNAMDLKSLPGSLGEALDELKKSSLLKAALGEHVYDHFIKAKTQEWDEYRTYVSAWELDRYLPIM
ncbi:MAG: type I glutamate--ammonia ligase [Candidatus Sericytochromatia bacterium]|nr:type I glutamate--ammonia ligase [Candidatus Sericytochromatia bacterium]